MSQAMIIGEEIGLSRWRAMWNSRERIEGDTFLINLGRVRSGLSWESQSNVEWNLRTLLLLARAKVVRLRYRPTPPFDRLPAELDDAFAARQKAYIAEQATLRPIELLDKNNPLTEAAWSELVEPDRLESRQESQANWRRMSEILDGSRPLPEILAEVYAVPRASIHSIASDHLDAVSTPPIPVPGIVSSVLTSALAGQAHLPIVTYQVKELRDQGQLVVDTLFQLAALGIREFALPPDWAVAPRWFQGINNPLGRLVGRSVERFIIVRAINEPEPLLHGFLAVPRVTLLGPDFAGRPFPSDLKLINRPLHIFLVPSETLEPEHPGRSLESGPHLRLESFYRLLHQ